MNQPEETNRTNFQRLGYFFKTKIGEPLITAKYPATFNTGLFICGLLMSIIDAKTFRLGLLLMLLACLGYAVIFAYCQVPPDDNLFADHASRRQSTNVQKVRSESQDGIDPDMALEDERKSAAPMRLLTLISAMSKRMSIGGGGRGSISAIGTIMANTSEYSEENANSKNQNDHSALITANDIGLKSCLSTPKAKAGIIDEERALILEVPTEEDQLKNLELEAQKFDSIDKISDICNFSKDDEEASSLLLDDARNCSTKIEMV